ncbi:hypothetical protein UY3_08911 [Chelonia mydas]|uniref:Uncharacterized protein n=1 Tax=Chelonia mydas TaxID=8469 RepID=M7BED7_CHEMY|nr:hypothetical protein UY3_08911 [Chelonia mydas]
MDSGVWVKERKTMHVCHDKVLDFAVHMWVVHSCMKGTLISGSVLKEKELTGNMIVHQFCQQCLARSPYTCSSTEISGVTWLVSLSSEVVLPYRYKVKLCWYSYAHMRTTLPVEYTSIPIQLHGNDLNGYIVTWCSLLLLHQERVDNYISLSPQERKHLKGKVLDNEKNKTNPFVGYNAISSMPERRFLDGSPLERGSPTKADKLLL